ncbi:MAG TPA: DUF4342 domain-containing protein [Anaerolineae bacterium]|nr:DUF4342 domain-containing protein [Anaerolineae bacterium]
MDEPSAASEEKDQYRREEFKVTGEQLLSEIKRLVSEGNIRRIVIRQGDKTLVEIPLTLGVIGIALAPVWAAIGAIAALVAECTIVVEKVE